MFRQRWPVTQATVDDESKRKKDENADGDQCYDRLEHFEDDEESEEVKKITKQSSRL